jgi:hypothetical protein
MNGTWPTIKKIIERDKPEILSAPKLTYGPETTTSKLAYDFGGGEDPMRGKNVTVVDLDSYGWEKEKKIGPQQKSIKIKDFKFIKADLTKPQKLPPVDLIVCSSFISNVLNGSNESIVASNIDNALKSGGYLYIRDFCDPVEEIMKYLPSYKLLEIFWNDEDGIDFAEVLLKK